MLYLKSYGQKCIFLNDFAGRVNICSQINFSIYQFVIFRKCVSHFGTDSYVSTIPFASVTVLISKDKYEAGFFIGKNSAKQSEA